MKNSLRKFIFFLFLISITFVGYRYMIEPANRRLAEQKNRIINKTARLEKLEEVTKTVKDLNKQLEQLEQAITFFENRLPPKSEIHKVLKQVTEIAQRHNLKPKTIQTLFTTENNSGYIEQPLKMELIGDFNAFYAFLLEMERLPRIMKIRELNVDKQNNFDGCISANFIVSIFFQDKV